MWNKLFFWKFLTFDRSYFLQSIPLLIIILHIEMSIVNLKIIFVEKQSTHANAQLTGRGATFITTEMVDCLQSSIFP